MCLAQGPHCSDASEARTLGLESSTLPLSHCAPPKPYAQGALRSLDRFVSRIMSIISVINIY